MYLSSYPDRDLFRTLSNIQDRAFYNKKNARVQVCKHKFFGAKRERFVELGPFDKDFVKNKKKRPRWGTFWSFFLLDTLRTNFE